MKRCSRFGNWVQNCGLINLGSVGPKYTWRGPICRGYNKVFERLDKGIGNHTWRMSFLEACIRVLARVKSDHHLILVEMNRGNNMSQGEPRPLRFEATWNTYEDFVTFIWDSWVNDAGLVPTLRTTLLREWNQNVFGNIFYMQEKGSSWT